MEHINKIHLDDKDLDKLFFISILIFIAKNKFKNTLENII